MRVVCGRGASGGVRYTVEDHGPGIPQDRLDAVFERFQQAGLTEGGDRLKGTGLGLAIAKALTELHGGFLEQRERLTDQRFVVPFGFANSELSTLDYSPAISSRNVS